MFSEAASAQRFQVFVHRLCIQQRREKGTARRSFQSLAGQLISHGFNKRILSAEVNSRKVIDVTQLNEDFKVSDTDTLD